MPVIPRYNEEVTQNVQPTPSVPMRNSIAEGMADVAGTLGNVAEQAKEYQLKVDTVYTTGLLAKWTEAKGALLQNEVLAKQGQDAIGIGSKALASYDKLNSDIRNQLKNDTQRYIFDRHTAMDRAEFDLSVNRHESQQFKIVQKTNSMAAIDAQLQDMSLHYQDPQAWQAGRAKLNQYVIDMAHNDGFGPSSEHTKDLLMKANSKAVVDRIKQTMTDNPTAADTLFKEYEQFIEPHERQSLKHTIGIMSDQKIGIDAAEQLTPGIMNGAKTYTELRTQLYNQLKDRPAAFKVAEQQLRGDYQAAKEDRSERAAETESKVESAIAKATGEGKIITPKTLVTMPEYQQLLKDGSKEANASAHRLMSQVEHEYKAELSERRAEAREARSERRIALAERKLEMSEVTGALEGNPELVNYNEADLREKLTPQIGAVNVQKVINSRRKMLKDEEHLQKATLDKDMMIEEMDAAELKYEIRPSQSGSDDFKATAKLINRVREQVRNEQSLTGKTVSPERQKEIIRGQLLKVHVRAKNWMGQGEEEKFAFETEYPENWIVSGATKDDVTKVVSILKRRGIVPTYQMVEKGVEVLKRK